MKRAKATAVQRAKATVVQRAATFRRNRDCRIIETLRVKRAAAASGDDSGEAKVGGNFSPRSKIADDGEAKAGGNFSPDSKIADDGEAKVAATFRRILNRRRRWVLL